MESSTSNKWAGAKDNIIDFPNDLCSTAADVQDPIKRRQRGQEDVNLQGRLALQTLRSVMEDSRQPMFKQGGQFDVKTLAERYACTLNAHYHAKSFKGFTASKRLP